MCTFFSSAAAPLPLPANYRSRRMSCLYFCNGESR